MGGPLDGTVWYIDPLPLLFFGLLVVYIIVLISFDFLPHKVKPMRICPRCGRRWPPLLHDPDTLLCNLCRDKIPLGPFRPDGTLAPKPEPKP